MLVSLFIWIVVFTIMFWIPIINIDIITTRTAHYSKPLELVLFFGTGIVISGFLLVLSSVKLAYLMNISALNRYLMTDEDGYVPLADICKALGKNEEKVLKIINYGTRKGFLVNMNYSMTEKAVFLSDKILRDDQAKNERGIPENRPFIGVHCPGCAASLKIRTNTKGLCPYCGREVIAPSTAE